MFLHRKSCESTQPLRSHPGFSICHREKRQNPLFRPDALCRNDSESLYRDIRPRATGPSSALAFYDTEWRIQVVREPENEAGRVTQSVGATRPHRPPGKAFTSRHHSFAGATDALAFAG